jgi:hypothetical protein
MPDYAMPEYAQKRLRYFKGQLLVAQDFIDEQNYHVDRERRHSRWLHSPGIAEGLAVSVGQEGDQVTVAPGTAVDSIGRQIVLAEPWSQALDTSSEKTLQVYIAYHQEGSDFSTADEEQGWAGDTRWHEQPQIELVPEGEEPPVEEAELRIALARLNLGDDSKYEVDPSVRRYAGVRLPSGEEPGQWPTLRSGESTRADLTGSLLVTGTADLGATRLRGDLSVAGKVGVGAATPDTLLTVGDGTNRDLLKLINAARGWKFTAGGSGSSTSLDLQALEGGKSFRVVSRNGTSVPLQVHTSDSAEANGVYLVQNGGKVGIGTTSPVADLDIRPTLTRWFQAGSGGDSGRLWVEYGGQRAPLLVLSDKDDPPRVQFQQTGTGTEEAPQRSSWIGLARSSSNDISIIGGKVGIGSTSPKRELHVTGNGGVLSLEGSDHVYIEWYPDGVGAGRKAYAGFGSKTTKDFTIANEINGGDIVLWPKGNGIVGIRAWDLYLGHPDRRGTMGRALVDGANTLIINYAKDWPNVKIEGKMTNGSSRDSKENIIALSSREASEALENLCPVKFNYRSDCNKELQLGFVAEDVPEIVGTSDRKAIAPVSIIAILTKALQMQQSRMEALEDEIRSLKQQLSGLTVIS